jgi:cell division protein ZapA
MTEMFAHVNVKILEKEYEVACPANERADLLDSAEMLNSKMREIRDGGKVAGLDRIAVMAALNLANDLLKARDQGEVLESAAKERLQAMRERVETVLQNGQQIKL